jgi:hypothetical protein
MHFQCEEKIRRKKIGKIKGSLDSLDILSFRQYKEAVLPNILQNDFSSTKEAAPPEEPELELFLEEP